MSYPLDMPRFEVVRFAHECERLLALAKTDGGLSEAEQEALQSYVDRLQALIAEHGETPDQDMAA